MRNKEIEELLNNFQEVLDNPTTTDECCDGRIIEIDRSYDLEQDEIKLLLSYIEQLEKRNKQLYEGFMATQEELTDYATKNEQLEKDKKELKDGWQQEVYDKNKVLNDWFEDERKINILENNRDKAIELLNIGITTYNNGGSRTALFGVIEDSRDILKGDSD